MARNFAKSEQLYLTALREFEGNPQLSGDLYNARQGLAEVYIDQRHYAEAKSIYLEQLAQMEQSPARNTLVHAGYVSMARLYEQEGRDAEAEQCLKAALAETEKAELWPNRGPLMCASRQLAQFYTSRQRYSEAEPLFKRALEILEKAEPGRNSSLPYHLNEFAKFYQDQGKYDAAGELYQRAVALAERYCGPEHASTIQSLNDLAALHRARGQYVEAEAIYRRALLAVEKTAALKTAYYLKPWKRLMWKRRVLNSIIRNVRSPLVTALSHLAECYEDQEKYAEAEPLRRRSIEITEEVWAKITPWFLADALENYARLLRKLGREAEAEELATRAKPVRAKYPKETRRIQHRLIAGPTKISLRWRVSAFITALRRPSRFQR